MILLDTNLLGRMTDSTDPQCSTSRRAVHVLLARPERLVIFPQNLYDFWSWPPATPADLRLGRTA
jgi:hypothetical protein